MTKAKRFLEKPKRVKPFSKTKKVKFFTKTERRERNRIAAYNSRMKLKFELQELKIEVKIIKEDNKKLNQQITEKEKENKKLKHQIKTNTFKELNDIAYKICARFVPSPKFHRVKFCIIRYLHDYDEIDDLKRIIIVKICNERLDKFRKEVFKEVVSEGGGWEKLIKDPDSCCSKDVFQSFFKDIMQNKNISWVQLVNLISNSHEYHGKMLEIIRMNIMDELINF